jgi:hypothetical protein
MLRTGLALFAAVTFCLSSTAFGADEAKPGARKPGDRQVPPDVLKRFDKNNDGKLDDAERAEAMKARGGQPGAGGGQGGRPDPAKMQELMKKYDKDGDGKLNDEEKKAAGPELMKLRGGAGAPGAGGRDPAKMQEMIKKFDKNGDGKLDDAERAEAQKSRGGAPGGKPRPKPDNN